MPNVASRLEPSRSLEADSSRNVRWCRAGVQRMSISGQISVDALWASAARDSDAQIASIAGMAARAMDIDADTRSSRSCRRLVQGCTRVCGRSFSLSRRSLVGGACRAEPGSVVELGFDVQGHASRTD